MENLDSHHRRRLPPSSRGRAQDKSRDEVIIGAALGLLSEKGYHALTMTDVAARAGVSKATLYRRWQTKEDLVADAVATLNPLEPPQYSGTSLRDDLLALVATIGNCDNRSDVVNATMEMSRSNPDLYRTLSERSGAFVRAELTKISSQYGPLSDVQLDVLGDTVIGLLAHYGGPAGETVSREQLARLVDHVLMVLIVSTCAER